MRDPKVVPRRKPITSSSRVNDALSKRIKPVATINKPRSWVIYGRAGSGKTTLLGTFPGPILLIDCKDEGTDSVSDVKGMEVFELETWQDAEDLYWYLRENPKKFKTVGIDTITQLQQILVEEIAAEKGIKGNKVAGDWGTLTKQDWGTVSSRLKKYITDMRSLDMEVVFLAQDRVFNAVESDEDVDTRGDIEPEVGPRLSPAVMSHLCSAVHMVGNTFIREKVTMKKVNGKNVETRKKEYCIRLGPSTYYITKLRKPMKIKLPDFLDNPTFEDILEIVTGE